MTDQQPVFANGAIYETYVGRWSRVVAPPFLEWCAIPAGGRWLDVGCGTGALTQTILHMMAPTHVRGIDLSAGFAAFAQAHIRDTRAVFEVGDAMALPVETGSYDAVVSGLMINFVPQPVLAAQEMVRVAKPGGTVAVYVWDYAGKMEFMTYFWRAAAALDPQALPLDEGQRFPICNPPALTLLFQEAGLNHVETQAIDIDTTFTDFDDYWQPFLGGQGPAPTYTLSLTEEHRTRLRDRLRRDLPYAPNGSIPLSARVWAVRGIKDGGS